MALKAHDATGRELAERVQSLEAERDRSHRVVMKTVRERGDCDWSRAKASQARDLGREATRQWLKLRRMGDERCDLKRTAGAALERVARPEARRIYSEVFPGLSRHKVAADVHSLVILHRANLRLAARAGGAI